MGKTAGLGLRNGLEFGGITGTIRLYLYRKSIEGWDVIAVQAL